MMPFVPIRLFVILYFFNIKREMLCCFEKVTGLRDA